MNTELRNKIQGIWDIFWSSGMTNPLTVIEQITYLMFIKLLDDNELKKESVASSFGMEVVDPVFDKEHQNCRWHNFKHLDADSMFNVVRNDVFPYITSGMVKGKDTAFAKHMQNALFLVPTPRVLLRVVDALDSLDMNDKDIMGDVYEFLLGQIAASGTNGQFRTPRHIIKMIIDLVEPNLDDDICDPAMGSAGFITCAAQYIKDHYSKELNRPEHKKHFTTTMFSGFDTDQTMLRIGAMNMMLHGVEAPNIAWQDSLSNDNAHRNEYSLIVANPPFAGNVDKETIAKDLLAISQTTKTELLFIAGFIKMLKVGGRCASVVPDGVLFGSSNAHISIRRELVDSHRLEAVISLPNGVFQPYSGVKTSIIIFTKTGNGGTDSVWFYDLQNDGFTLDIKRVPMEGSNIPDVVMRFHNLKEEIGRGREEQSFFVDVNDIRSNNYDLTINKYKRVIKDQKSFRNTKEIMFDLEEANKNIVSLLNELKSNLDN